MTRHHHRSSQPTPDSQPGDYHLGQSVWTRVTGTLELAEVVEILDGSITVRIDNRLGHLDKFDPYFISSAT